jgi:transcriptional regulator with XRE-family HTH domain
MPGHTLGDLLKYWRRVRGTSQLQLASAAATTPRYVSFVETGRARPSQQMVLRLAGALDVPLRERNGLLLAAGYAPSHPSGTLGTPDLALVDTALTTMLESHEPFPAVVLDRGWNVLRANKGAIRLFGSFLNPLPEPANVLRLMIEPGPVRDAVLNWGQVAPALLDRARREAVGGVLDLETANLVNRLRSEVTVSSAEPLNGGPVLAVRFLVAGKTLSFFSVVSTIGTPIDVTAQELRVEAFFPTDDTTRENWTVTPSEMHGAHQ